MRAPGDMTGAESDAAHPSFDDLSAMQTRAVPAGSEELPLPPRRSGADAGELIAAGGGLFTGELPVRGAVDNGSHEIEVIATQGKYEDRRPDFYNVKTPAPGTEAWFADLANDVLIDGDVVWVIGASSGDHEAKDTTPTREMIARLDLHTGDPIAPTIIAPPDGEDWTESVFFLAALHPEGVVVTGYGRDSVASLYRIETSRYTTAGARPWHQRETSNSGLAYGSDVALDSQGRALVAGAVTQNGKLRGYVFGRAVDDEDRDILLEHWFPGVGPSEGLGIARDAFDRISPVGYVTSSGTTQARITRVHGSARGASRRAAPRESLRDEAPAPNGRGFCGCRTCR